MNSVNLVGRLTRDPELRYIPGNGTPVGNLSIAVDRPFAKEGQVKVDFFNIVVWGKSAENCANYLAKGSQIAVQGRLQNDTFETQSGEKRTITKVVADRVEFLGSKNKSDYNSNNQNSFEPSFGSDTLNMDQFQALDDEDIPF